MKSVIILFILLWTTGCYCSENVYSAENSIVILKCMKCGNNILWRGPQDYQTYAINSIVNTGLVKSSRLSVHTNKSSCEQHLQISKFSKEDEGCYKCTSPNQNPASDKGIDTFFNVQMQKDPSNLTIKNEEENHRVYGYIDKSLTLECSAIKGIPSLPLEWLKEGRTVAVGGPEYVNYTILPQIKDHLKNYTCIASDVSMDTPAQRTVHLYLFETAAVTIQNEKPIEIIEGENISLKCTYISNHDINAFIWMFTSFDHSLEEIVSYNATVLKYDNIDRNKSGTYQCIVQNKAGSAEDDIDVIVQYLPNVVIKHSITKGKELKCIPHGVPAKYYFRDWEHLSFFEEHIRYLADDGNGTLNLNNTNEELNQYSDNGIYVCRVSNGISVNSSNISSAEFLVNNSGLPYFPRSNNSTQYGTLEHHSKLSVFVVSMPTFTNISLLNDNLNELDVISCYMNIRTWNIVYGKNITIMAFKITFDLNIKIAQDFHPYTVVVRNTQGSSNHSVILKSASPPQMPVFFKSLSRSTEIEIIWIPMFNGGFKQTFFLRYKKKVEGNKWKHVNAGTKNMTILQKLDPDTEYIIQLYARNSVGDSNFTDENIIKTEKERKIKVLYIILPVICVLIIGLIVVGYRKANLLKRSIVRCMTIDRADNVSYNEVVGGVENNIYDFGNNLAVTSNNQDVPVYSSINRRDNSRIGQVTTYALSEKNAPQTVGNVAQNNNETNEEEGDHTEPRHRLIKESNNLNYIEICFEEKPKDYKFIIRGSGNKTPYADIDFTQTAPCLSSSEEEQDSDDDFMDIEDVQMMKKPT